MSQTSKPTLASVPNSAVYRLQKDYKQLIEDPIPGLLAQPNPENILEWYFVVCGPHDTPFEGGYYLGSLKFPPEYPFKGPRLMFHTPNGRFAILTRICLSVTDYHEEYWNPTWNVGSLLNATVSFMTGNEPTYGTIRSSPAERKMFAKQSLAWCLNNADFRQHFPTLKESIEKILREENKYDEAMKEYQELEQERARNPEKYRHFYDMEMMLGLVRQRVQAARDGNPPFAEMDPAGNAVPGMALEGEERMDAMMLRMQNAMAQRRERVRERVQAANAATDLLRHRLRSGRHGSHEAPPLWVPGPLPPIAPLVQNPVPVPPPAPVAQPYDQMTHIQDDRERMRAILASHLNEIDQMNKERLHRTDGHTENQSAAPQGPSVPLGPSAPPTGLATDSNHSSSSGFSSSTVESADDEQFDPLSDNDEEPDDWEWE